MIYSDWHIHSENSYDATLTLDEIAQLGQAQGMKLLGITDHANFNDEKFMGDLRNSAKAVKEAQKKYPFLVLGVELTPIEKPEYDYIAKTGTREGYVAPVQEGPFAIELAATKEELLELGVRYTVAGSHWRVDVPGAKGLPVDIDATIREWHRQQMWMACDDRVTILAHPWYNGKALWYQDFSVIPHSMHLELGAALKEHGKFVECNSQFVRKDTQSEKYRYQYAEFLRELFEMGIPITYGSDMHKEYPDWRPKVEQYLTAAGFKEGDFSELTEKDLW